MDFIDKLDPELAADDDPTDAHQVQLIERVNEGFAGEEAHGGAALAPPVHALHHSYIFYRRAELHIRRSGIVGGKTRHPLGRLMRAWKVCRGHSRITSQIRTT